MSHYPLLNALAAVAYIAGISSGVYYIPKTVGEVDTVLAPVAFLSLFVLSAGVMIFIFFYQPIQLYSEDKRREAITLFVRSLGAFAGVTFIVLVGLILLAATS